MPQGAMDLAGAQPPSPALTNVRDSMDFADMILPFNGALGFMPSPPRNRKQPPSPPDSDKMPGIWSHSTQLNYSMPIRTFTPHNRNPSTLSAIYEADTTPKKYAQYHTDNLASSPKLEDPPAVLKAKHERRWSNGSVSVHSDDIDNWPDFDGGPSEVDEEQSVLLEEEEEQLGNLPKIADSDDPATDEQWVNGHADTSSLLDDPLSRRADMILANAKKRLHVMEGNLRGARNSLLISAPSSPASSHFSPLTDFMKERPRYSTAAGVYGHRSRQYSASPLGSNGFGHVRGVSDVSSAGLLAPRALPTPKRASSALGSFARGLNSLEKSNALRGVRSQEAMRENRLQIWIEESPVPHALSRPSSSHQGSEVSVSPSMEAFPRPTSAASSLRSQMDELKGRINNLKARTLEDRRKRMSLAAERTASPFSTAEKWSASADAAKSQGLNTSTGAGWSPTHSPLTVRSGPDFPLSQSRKPSSSNSDSESARSKATSEPTRKYAESNYEDAEESLGRVRDEEESDAPSTPSTAVLNLSDEQKVLMGPQDSAREDRPVTQTFVPGGQEDTPVEDEDSGYDPDTQSIDGQSEYFEAVPVLAERHEDRADAFDYENFFLHSAMGTYTHERRDSLSSEGSVETTRPTSPRARQTSTATVEDYHEVIEASSPPSSVRVGFGTLVEASPGQHRRSQSVESISTVATFQTATEGDAGSDSDEGGLLDAVTQHLISPKSVSMQIAPSRMVEAEAHTNPVHSEQTMVETVGEDANDQKHRQQLVSALLSSLMQTKSKTTPPKDVALLEGVLTSLQKVVENLHSQTEDYDRRRWRRRLDAARQALDGDDAEESF